MEWSFIEIVALISAISAVVTLLDKAYVYGEKYTDFLKNAIQSENLNLNS